MNPVPPRSMRGPTRWFGHLECHPIRVHQRVSCCLLSRRRRGDERSLPRRAAGRAFCCAETPKGPDVAPDEPPSTVVLLLQPLTLWWWRRSIPSHHSFPTPPTYKRRPLPVVVEARCWVAVERASRLERHQLLLLPEPPLDKMAARRNQAALLVVVVIIGTILLLAAETEAFVLKGACTGVGIGPDMRACCLGGRSTWVGGRGGHIHVCMCVSAD